MLLWMETFERLIFSNTMVAFGDIKKCNEEPHKDFRVSSILDKHHVKLVVALGGEAQSDILAFGSRRQDNPKLKANLFSACVTDHSILQSNLY